MAHDLRRNKLRLTRRKDVLATVHKGNVAWNNQQDENKKAHRMRHN